MIFDDIGLNPDGSVSYRQITLQPDGSKTFHRAAVPLGHCIDGVWTLADNSGVPAEAMAAAQELWTPDVISAARTRAEAKYEAHRNALRTPANVDIERDRRMGTFTFGGKAYDLKGQSLANVSGAGTLSLAAIINGAQPGDLRWADPDADFTWIANDNTMTPMDAQTCWAFAQTAASHRKDMIFKARAIKDMSPIPADYTANSYWE